VSDPSNEMLMVAFQYPPFQGSSGIQRTMKFVRYLPQFGWRPVVLTASPRAYPQVTTADREPATNGTQVTRAFALDAARHLAVRGAYLRWTALPDRWVSWWLGAVRAGLAIIYRRRPRVIWSTYPIATAHLIGLTLHRLTGIPWVADFRDPMTDDGYPEDRATLKAHQWIERQTVTHCARAVFTSPGALQMYAERYRNVPESRWAIIENGYDEQDFAAAEAGAGPRQETTGPTVLVHSGVLYQSERDPNAFFSAVAELRQRGDISPANLRIVLRASGNESHYTTVLRRHRIEDIIALEPAHSHVQALREMRLADGLLVFQAANCNRQIPAKIYEYLRAGRPIFAMTDPQGDTAEALRAAGIDTIVSLDSSAQIALGLREFLGRVRRGDIALPKASDVERYSRRRRTEELAGLLDSLSLAATTGERG